ncbi:bifunctional metallophosphatase/5'-nucleotidase [Sediminibacillus albus]|uniref:2',3'-cyclic-nucleotide 2'-phosphodiesterase / 3'-nucleotidase n=1 Tax=Sediminibacillus albus TaxID=407036 RepID=A0A1G8ZSM2_9BACI|nr:bifunctional UDP-sugar hydrolase/5'-nucleotidase [Sediminibacillus albus]SDK18119.1 2',3'-cyclic-nucleotide 2'-phosphodiesterase / 3'-nucleotidase [Sediminibacillus albus]
MEAEINVLVTSDIHGYIYPTTYRDNSDQGLGLAKVASLVKRKREETNVLLLDNGDIIQGSPLTYYHAKYKANKENPVIKAANYLTFDASIFGNHEFNYGQHYLKRVVEQADFPWLSANVIDKASGKPLFGQPYVIKELQGVRIAVLGVTTHFIPHWEEPRNIESLEFPDALQTAKQWVKYIKAEESPDVMIVSYHGGFERDLTTGEPTERLTGENQGYQMCQELEGIDLLITGHQHRTIAEKVNNIAVVQPGNNGQTLGEVKIALQHLDGRWEVKDSVPVLHEIDEHIEADKGMLDLIADFEAETQQWLDRPIGKISGDMSISDPLITRMQDNPLIEFINKVQMDAAGVDIANTALFNNDSPGFGENVTMRDIVSNYVYPNTLNVIRISGKDIKDALEQSATYFIVENGKIKVNPAFIEPKPQHYNYDMWEGIEYELKISNPVGERVVQLDYQGKPIELNKQYDVVMNNYRASGAGDFDMFQGKPLIKDIPIDMTELIADYILQRKTIQATCNNNWRVSL